MMCVLGLAALILRLSVGAEALVSSTSGSQVGQQQIQVRVERHLPHITAQAARKAWFDFVWEKGGGLPLVGVVPRKSREASSDVETVVERRMLLPIGMEEELLLDSNRNSDRPPLIQYRVVNGGLLESEIVPDSHLGSVSFEPVQDDGSLLVWDVTFEATTPSRAFLWREVTERTVAFTCTNFQAYVSKPRIFQRTTFLRTNEEITTEQAADEWVNFCWKEGGGLPLPIPPIQTGDGARWIVPPFLNERIVSRESIKPENDLGSEGNLIIYQVENPNLFTYQVFSHQGRVRFTSQTSQPTGESRVFCMHWEVEIRPYPIWESVVEHFTAAVVSCYSRNFKNHIEERNAFVPLKPPRGGVGSSGDNTLLKVRKDSWVGGVLEAHLEDKRNTMEQTIALFQPWTWGRTPDLDEEGEGEEWIQ